MRKIFDIFKICMLIIPVLVILGHDIVPHHHHQENDLCHQEHEADHRHQTNCDLHSHTSSESDYCTFEHNRFIKKFNFQLLVSTIHNSNTVDSYTLVSKTRLVNISIKVKFLLKTFYLRGPPIL